jgi:putative DNA methylase
MDESEFKKRTKQVALRVIKVVEALPSTKTGDVNPVVIRAERAEIARCVASLKVERGELKREDVLPGSETVSNLLSKGRVQINEKGIIEDRKLPLAESVDAFLLQHAPPLLDPFCSGGSIPLETQRLGLRAYASDLNPVAILITKALIEIPPKFANMPPVNPDTRGKGLFVVQARGEITAKSTKPKGV